MSLSIVSSPFMSRNYLLIYRGLCATFLAYTIVAGALVQMPAPYVMYLTNWMVMLNFCYFTSAALALALPKMGFIRKAAYHLNEICLPNAMTVCLLFWSIVFPRLKDAQSNVKGPIGYIYFRVITDHGGTLLLLLFDFFISRTVFPIKHVYWPSIVFLYIPVSAIYTLIYNEIYPGLTFRDVTSLGFVVFAVTTTLLSFVVLVYFIPRYKSDKTESASEILVHKTDSAC